MIDPQNHEHQALATMHALESGNARFVSLLRHRTRFVSAERVIGESSSLLVPFNPQLTTFWYAVALFLESEEGRARAELWRHVVTNIGRDNWLDAALQASGCTSWDLEWMRSVREKYSHAQNNPLF
jgi:hypothetical protein